MVKRKDNWPELLSAYLSERRKMPFKWGENDCLQFASRCVERLTGDNFYEEYLGYTTKEGAEAVLAEHGGVIAIITRYLGQGTRNFLTATRGDLAIIKMPEITAGIVDDSGRNIMVVHENGIIRVPLDKAWRIWSY